MILIVKCPSGCPQLPDPPGQGQGQKSLLETRESNLCTGTACPLLPVIKGMGRAIRTNWLVNCCLLLPAGD